MYNQQRFDNSVYDDATIVNEAVIWNQHINKAQTNWMLTQYTTFSVEDEIAYMDVGMVEPREFHQYKLNGLGLSYSDNFEGYYKIAGFTIFRDLNRVVISRSVYDVLNFLGDIGGLSGILGSIGDLLVARFANFMGVGYFMQQLFYTYRNKEGQFSESDTDEPEKRELGDQITRTGLSNGQKYSQKQLDGLKSSIEIDFDRQRKIMNPTIPQLGFMKIFCRRRYRAYLKQHGQAIDKIDNDFDFCRIVKTIRIHNVQLKSLFNLT